MLSLRLKMATIYALIFSLKFLISQKPLDILVTDKNQVKVICNKAKQNLTSGDIHAYILTQCKFLVFLCIVM